MRVRCPKSTGAGCNQSIPGGLALHADPTRAVYWCCKQVRPCRRQRGDQPLNLKDTVMVEPNVGCWPALLSPCHSWLGLHHNQPQLHTATASLPSFSLCHSWLHHSQQRLHTATVSLPPFLSAIVGYLTPSHGSTPPLLTCPIFSLP